jgi:FtsP/CotA-like multicopper oxidase with cupredoxin domain
MHAHVASSMNNELIRRFAQAIQVLMKDHNSIGWGWTPAAFGPPLNGHDGSRAACLCANHLPRSHSVAPKGSVLFQPHLVPLRQLEMAVSVATQCSLASAVAHTAASGD